jgi:hypothetical protein
VNVNKVLPKTTPHSSSKLRFIETIQDLPRQTANDLTLPLKGCVFRCDAK